MPSPLLDQGDCTLNSILPQVGAVDPITGKVLGETKPNSGRWRESWG
jgi:hypothetical protein